MSTSIDLHGVLAVIIDEEGKPQQLNGRHYATRSMKVLHRDGGVTEIEMFSEFLETPEDSLSALEPYAVDSVTCLYHGDIPNLRSRWRAERRLSDDEEKDDD